MNILPQTKTQTRKQELIDWWIDELVKRNIPMLENKDDKGKLSPACEHAQERGAKLITREELTK